MTRSRSSSLGTASVGILGAFLQEPEIIGVFPSLSATYMPHGQDIVFHRGDSFDVPIQIQNDLDPPDPFRLDNAVVRWAAKQNKASESIPPSDLNLLIRKSSYDQSEIEITNATKGQAVLKIRRADTMNLPQSVACWDLEVTIPKEELFVPDNAFATTVKQSPTVMITGLDATSLGLMSGDILATFGDTPHRVLIKNVLSPTMIETDYTGWDAETAIDFSLFRTSTRTVASGRFRALLDVA
jgi:hypothetical protein